MLKIHSQELSSLSIVQILYILYVLPVREVDIETFHWISKNFDRLVVLQEKSRHHQSQ